MELNWSTFLLEIFNFLVLVWILKRFLYQPVLDAIERRRAAIEAQLAETRQLHTESEALKTQYEHRLADWEQERQKALQALQQEVEEKRSQQLQNLQTSLAEEEEKSQVARSRKDHQAQHQLEQRALQQGAAFASRLLAEAAGPELENRLLDMLLSDLASLSEDQVKALSEKHEGPAEVVHITTAYPLSDENRQRLERALSVLIGPPSAVRYEQEAGLLAGLNITIGAWALHLNVRDELKGFTELTRLEH